MTFEQYLAAWAGKNYKSRADILVDILHESPDESWTIAEFKAILDEVPAELHDTVKVTLKDEGWQEQSTYLRIFYHRPETDEEWAARVKGIEDQCRHEYDKMIKKQEEQDRLDYERLKAKFETKP